MIRLLIATLIIISTITCSGTAIMKHYNYTKEIDSYLKLAADAPSVEIASEFLRTAITNVERRGLTSGNSALIFQNPTSDIGIWYQQIKGAYQNCVNVLADSSATQLTKDNTLMKLRETLLDQSEDGASVTRPSNIYLYPYTWNYVIIGTMIAISTIIGFGVLLAKNY